MKLHTKKAFTLIELMIVIAIIAIIAAIAIPNLLSARKNGNEAAAIGGLKAIANAQTLYREGDKDGNNTLEYAGAIGDLHSSGAATEDLIDQVLANGTKQGYDFTVTAGMNDQFVWFANANPTVAGTTGDRRFGGNMAGLIFFDSAAPIGFDAMTGMNTSGQVLGN